MLRNSLMEYASTKSKHLHKYTNYKTHLNPMQNNTFPPLDVTLTCLIATLPTKTASNIRTVMTNHLLCLCVVQVQAALKRQWMQYKTQWGQRRKDHCSMRSTSYTATSITEVPAFMYHHDCNSEHLNGRHAEDSELVALKSGETYAWATPRTRSVASGTS